MTPDPAIRVIAHRGASAEACENTEAAVRLALSQGADAVECDVQWSGDGVPVVLHDADLVRLGVPGPPIAQLPWQELRGTPLALPGRSGAPALLLSLEQWLALLPPAVMPVVELKRQADASRLPQQVRACLQVLEARPDARVISFGRDLLRVVQSLAPTRCSGPITHRPWDEERRARLRQDARGCLVVKKTVLDRQELSWFRRQGHDVWCYALDEPPEMEDALGQGVTGLITNRPAVARRFLDQAGS